MKPKLLWLAFAAVLLAVLAWRLGVHRPAPAKPPEVAIQDGKTLDFSNGRPVVKDTPADKAIIDAAVQEMHAAAKNVTFPPLTAPAPKK